MIMLLKSESLKKQYLGRRVGRAEDESPADGANVAARTNGARYGAGGRGLDVGDDTERRALGHLQQGLVR